MIETDWFNKHRNTLNAALGPFYSAIYFLLHLEDEKCFRFRQLYCREKIS